MDDYFALNGAFQSTVIYSHSFMYDVLYQFLDGIDVLMIRHEFPDRGLFCHNDSTFIIFITNKIEILLRNKKNVENNFYTFKELNK